MKGVGVLISTSPLPPEDEAFAAGVGAAFETPLNRTYTSPVTPTVTSIWRDGDGMEA